MPRELKQDTLADICQKIRDAGIHDLADHIEAAWKRQMSQSWHHREMEELIAKHEKEVAELKKQTGNAAAMHAALVNLTRPTETDIRGLENIAKYAMGHSMYGGGVLQALCGAIREGKLALAEPPRNCDIHPKRDEASKAFQETVLTERERERAKKYPLAVMDWFIDWLLETTCNQQKGNP